MKLVDPRLGRRLREIRRARRLTQRELAKATGISVRSLRNFERLTSAIEARQAHRLALALGCEFVTDFVLPLEDANGTRRSNTSAARQPIDGDSVREG